MKKLILALLILLLIIGCINPSNTKSSDDVLKGADSALKISKEISAKYERERESWKYEDDTNAMTSKVNHYASTESTNELSLSPPYDGYNYAHLTVRNRNGIYGAVIGIDKGQFIFGVYGTDIKVRFDKNPYKVYSALRSSDGDPKVMFINGKDFIINAKKSKNIIIQTTIYEAGNQLLYFNTDSLKFDIAGPKQSKYNQYGGIDYGFHPTTSDKDVPPKSGYIAVSGKNRNGHDTVIYIKGYQ